MVNIIERLSGSGTDDNVTRIPDVTVERQKKETKWMLTLQTIYPYMAEKESRIVGNKFLRLPRLYKRPDYNCSKGSLKKYISWEREGGSLKSEQKRRGGGGASMCLRSLKKKCWDFQNEVL